jgi:hypothetical protein
MLLRIVAAVVTVLALASVPTPASATRPVPGVQYTDQCNNFPGVQPVYMMVGSGPYREDVSTQDPDDCIRISKYPFVPPPVNH